MQQLASVSVVIPCHDAAADVRTAVASVLAQTHPPLEIICVDDGSTDDTLAVLRELEAAHPELVLVIAQENRGACAARNRGLAEARGTYIQFLDADDELAPEKLRHQVALAERERADIVAGAHWHRSLDGRMVPGEFETEDAWTSLVLSRLGITSANLWRTEAVRAAGGWNEAWASSQEYELMFRLLQRGARVAFDEESLTTIHEREGSISRASDEVFKRYVRLRTEIAEHLWAEGLLTGRRREAALERVFLLLRRLHAKDPAAALAYHRRAIPPDYSPPVSAANTRPFLIAYRLLGFKQAEQLRTLMRRPEKVGK